ncbi:DUF3027 domain-containing protein [Brevibacterium samyangense]|uniref:DUF3027 domain-containing protein n=1 Tax=Brevibacterium samyangense TaxID=366888 RepID=A0ABN2T6N2_9MICO
MNELFTNWSAAARAVAAVRSDGAGSTARGRVEAGDAEAAAPARRRSASARSAKPAQDALLLGAVAEARQAIADVADPAHIGEHLGAVMEGQRLATHSFACTDRAYRGWHWVAVLARAPRSKKITVCETALLPGDDALVAPVWVPWEERIRPGDLGPRDVLPRVEDDPDLMPGFEQVPLGENLDVDRVPNFELGLGRARVLSPQGISDAASRWRNSEAGPEGEFARKAEAQCSTCGFLMPMAGSLRTAFGVCANAWSPFDGRVVALDAGCGAHSETDVPREPLRNADPVVDDYRGELEVSGASTGTN